MNDERQEPRLPEEGVDPYIFMQPTPPKAPTEPVFRPRQKDGISPLTVGLLVASAVVGLFAIGQWAWLTWRRPVPPPPAIPVVEVRAPAEAPAPVRVPDPAPTEASAADQVHRCVNAVGEIAFTDGPCPAGTQASVVNTAPALQTDEGGGATIFRCRGAGYFWSAVHCQHKGASVVESYTVPARLSVAEQIVFAKNRAAQLKAPRPKSPRATDVGPPAPPTAAQLKAQRCKRLDQLVAALDDLARQPHSGSEQDRITRQRRDARNEQFRLRCGR